VGFNYFLSHKVSSVHYADMVTLNMALNLPLNTLGLIITYNVLNLKSLSYRASGV